MEKKANIKLIEFRQKIKKTPEKMAQLLDVSTSYYYKIEAGSRNPSYNFLHRFKKEFPQADVDEIFLKCC